MYGQYLTPAAEEEEPDQGTADGFSLTSLLESTKKSKYQRRLGRGSSSTTKAVRPGVTARGGAAQPAVRRMNTGSKPPVSGPEFERKLSEIEEEDAGRQQHKEDSLAELMSGLAMDTPGNKGCKISPDSGSFTMTGSESRGADSINFTDSLPGSGRAVRPARGGGTRPAMAPIRMNMSGVGEAGRGRTGEWGRAGADDKENQEDGTRTGGSTQAGGNTQGTSGYSSHRVGGQQHTQGGGTGSIKDRLSQLAGSNMTPRHRTQAAPNPLPSTPAPARQPATPAPQWQNAVSRQQPITPSPAPAFATPSQPAMPPPAALQSTAKNKELVLVVRGKRYKVMRLLGRGGSSRVYEAFDEERKLVVAIKRVDLSEADEDQTAGYVNEINMLVRLQQEDRIVKLHDWEQVEEEEILYVVMEKGDTDLASLIKKYLTNKELTPAMIKHYWNEMLLAVTVIHKRGIIHKDLKPANFLLVAGTLKLIDFGIASSVQSDKTHVLIDNQMGTFNYMSPESIQDLSGPQYDKTGDRKPVVKISYKSDVWSLGCILYQLTYGRLPFADIKHPMLKLQAITNPDHPVQYPALPDTDPRLVTVIKACLQRDCSARLSIHELLQHEFLTGPEGAVVVGSSGESEKKMDAVSAMKMLASLEGVLSPATYKKTKEGLRTVIHKGGT